MNETRAPPAVDCIGQKGVFVSSSPVARARRYLVLRRDLQETDAWPLGALIAQGAHAAVAAVARTWDTDETRAYRRPSGNLARVS